MHDKLLTYKEKRKKNRCTNVTLIMMIKGITETESTESRCLDKTSIHKISSNEIDFAIEQSCGTNNSLLETAIIIGFFIL